MSYVNLINSLSNREDWNYCVTNIIKKSKTIDTTDIKQVTYTKIVSSRFMLFSLTKEMSIIEKKLNNGKNVKGYSLDEIERAFTFYNLRK